MTVYLSECDLKITAQAFFSGTDLTVAVFGGEKPHIGSVSVAVPRQSLIGDGSPGSTTSTINLTGHKDNAIGDMFASRLSMELGCVCAVTCGIHIDGLTPDGINKVMELGENLLKKLLNELKK